MSNSSGSEEPLIDVRDLEVVFVAERPVYAVRGLSYQIRRGECFGLVGESGSGKSVSAMATVGLLPPFARVTGSVDFEGRNLLTLPRSELRRVRGGSIATVFQDPLTSLNPVLTIGRQIDEVLETHSALSGRDARRRAVELLELVHIPDASRRLKQYPHQLSGGMRQRAMLAMALAGEPSLLIADEPTTALDVTIQAQILELLRELRQRLGMAILLITHDLGVIAGLADHVGVMYAGRLVESGPTREILRQPSHPYTAGLLRSIPRIDRMARDRLIPISGAPPDLHQVETGCPFAPRCPRRLARCWTEMPERAAVTPSRVDMASHVDEGHFAACHNTLREGGSFDQAPAPPPPGRLSELEADIAARARPEEPTHG